MSDIRVSMSPEELPDEALREALARALRDAEGQEVNTTGVTLSLVVEGIDWWEIAIAAQSLIEAVWRDDDVDGLIAFDFGTGERFIVQVDLLDRQTLVAVVPAREMDEQVRQLVRGWVWRSGWGSGHYPSVIRSSFAGEAWLTRELTMALRGNEVELAAQLTTSGAVIDVDPVEAMEHWDHAVMVDGGAPAIDLFEWGAGGECGAFAAWLNAVSVVWDDTGVDVAPEDGLRLWLVCQYLALP